MQLFGFFDNPKVQKRDGFQMFTFGTEGPKITENLAGKKVETISAQTLVRYTQRWCHERNQSRSQDFLPLHLWEGPSQ